ncbi:acylneuraminate cytidylyltransferase family protein [Dongia rigui]|uniref:Acylneuraminate cytidylyltransferase family protein n=1 Tax=Dongia rigui TaxID=940149 RepID=A0ABU5E223_9PROT|nr:acylneuraminate cytidylyltransferase family protein [Dongia rigui]MDY0873659.1 acylneuraminate cytidylyltransferase family protein [Dongia rigui]
MIFARGGSKGVPRKNVRPLAGRPLIAHAIDAARHVPAIGRVVVSTDDAEIAAAARAAGAEVPFMRPAELATDGAAEWLAWRHAITALRDAGGKIDLFVSVPAVCPLRTNADIEACIARYEQGDADLVMTAIEAKANPYYTLVELDAAGAPHLVKQPPASLSGRQQAPKVLQLVAGCYVASPDFILAQPGIWAGRLRLVEIAAEHGVDIDTEIDFALADLLLTRRGQI